MGGVTVATEVERAEAGRPSADAIVVGDTAEDMLEDAEDAAEGEEVTEIISTASASTATVGAATVLTFRLAARAVVFTVGAARDPAELSRRRSAMKLADDIWSSRRPVGGAATVLTVQEPLVQMSVSRESAIWASVTSSGRGI